jgi:hypothetical protein
MRDAIFSILILSAIYRAIMGEWPDINDPDFQRAIEETLERASHATSTNK